MSKPQESIPAYKQVLHFIALILQGLWRITKFLFSSLKRIWHYGTKNYIYTNKRLKKLFRFSISFKITVVYGFIISFILLATSACILLSFRLFLIEQTRMSMEKSVEMVKYSLKDPLAVDVQWLNQITQQEKLELLIHDAQHKVIYTTKGTDPRSSYDEGLRSPKVIKRDGLEKMKVHSRLALDEQVLYLQFSKNLSAFTPYMEGLAAILITINTLALFITLMQGRRLSKKMLLPIEHMTQTVKAINVQALGTRLDVKGSQDELKELAETINEMFDRLQDAYERQNQFVSDASHELRTPISVVQGYANLLDRWGKENREVLDESISAIKGESENMKDLIEKLLFLARCDKNLQKLEKNEFDVHELIDEVIKETRLIDSKHGILSTANDRVSILGDRNSLKQALRIFIDNSVKYTPPGGTIEISSQLHKKQLMITIQDTGVGIPKEDLPHIFDRFYRSDKSRTKESGGHGLGLSIAKWVIDQHGGKIQIESVVQKGTKVTILLPNP